VKNGALQILLVEDNLADARLLREMFSKEKRGSFEFAHFMRMTEALKHLATHEVDVVLLDMGLPDAHGMDTVRLTRAAAPGVPVIVLTGLDDEAVAAEAMKEGALDYLIKGQIENRALPRALRHAIERHRMQAETDAIRTQQLQFKDEFLSHVSHELRTPLNAIYQFVTILLDGLAGELQQEQREHLGIVLRNVKQLESMISDLLEVTGVQTAKLPIAIQSTSVPDAVAYTVNTLQVAATAKEIDLSFHIASDLPTVSADPMRLRQVLIILVDNAIKFTPASGTVRIQARMLEEDPNLVILEVADSGSGVDPQMTERIFERLFQAQDPALAGRKGLGLGLFICKELVTRQGGKVWARRAAAGGSIFAVTLPVFSLPRLIARAFGKEGRTEHPITLVVTELGSQAGWLSDEARVECSQAVRELLQRCLQSDLDVLLPKMGSSGAVDLFFIVAVTDAVGGEAISRRIREQLDRSDYLEQAGLKIATSYQSFDVSKRIATGSSKDFLQQVAAKIQVLMSQENSSRTVRNGQ
jgi:signal transduction histidine kinase